MVLEVGVFAETATAHVAFERPRPAVDVHVRFQVARRRERLGAEGALVRLLLLHHQQQQQHKKKKSQEKKKEKEKPLISSEFNSNVMHLC